MSASMRPNASSAVCAIAVAEAAFATSSLAQTAVPFSACTRSSVCAQSLTSASTTRAPRPARYRANSRPMPRAAPVTTTTFASTFMLASVSLRRLDAEVLGNRGDLVALLPGCLTEFRRPADVEDLPARGKPLADHRIGGNDRANIRRDPLAQLLGHAGRPEQADQAIEGQFAVAGLLHGRYVGAAGARTVLVTASSLTFPACSCGRTIASAAMYICTRPSARSLAAST